MNEGFRKQETGNGRFRTGPVKAGKMGWDEVGEWQRCAVSAVPVPTKLLNLCVRRTHMPYSVTTSDPNNFKDNGCTLLQVHCGPPRRTPELSIIMTMYNKANNLFTSIMHCHEDHYLSG